MTNKEWLLNKINNANDDELATLLMDYQPILNEDGEWIDRYRNPFDREFVDKDYAGFGWSSVKEEKFYTNFLEAKNRFINWLKWEYVEKK